VEAVDCVVIGAGVIGLAVAREAARAGRDVVVVEAERRPGTVTSSRNSEVVHAGIYYPAGSLKARLCVEGRERLYRYCELHRVAYRRLGKLVVATTDEQRSSLAELALRARTNGVSDLIALDAREARTLEPALSCTAALLSPSTGIVDSHGYLSALEDDARDAGAVVAVASRVTRGRAGRDGIELTVGGAEPLSLRARSVFNCAGLDAASVAASIDGVPAAVIPHVRYCKGSYFRLASRSPFSRLVYPVPEPGGLGVHVTLDLGGQARFGPDVEWIDAIDYAVDARHGDGFYAAIRRYWPGLHDGGLVPDYAGIRPKLSGPGESPRDFAIDGPQEHGVAGLVNLFGIESPGLTAALAIAEYAVAMLAATD